MKYNKLAVNINYILKNIIDVVILKREKAIADLLLKKSLILSTAESCTGGLLSSRMTDVSGSSAFIYQNFVTYSNEAKVNILGINPETVEKFGVVSEQVALEMATGLLNRYNCDIALTTTGIAGPTGATDTKPVGLICIAVANKSRHKTYTYKANPFFCRQVMKYEFSNIALDYLLEFLKEI